MARKRRDVWKLGPGWNDTLLWYARGVKVLDARDINDRTSWRYLAAMHGFHPSLWQYFKYLGSDEAYPDPAKDKVLNQCQHGSWYFLPWHRSYLQAFEAIILAAIVKLGGPGDWALPYWNYHDATNADRLKLPTAFDDATWPDGGDNPLKVKQRYGPDGDGTVVLDPDQMLLRESLQADRFAGVRGGSQGFGGLPTPFSHRAEVVSGLLEESPHNNVHSMIGGFIRGEDDQDPRMNGLMSMPETAALDPIFWIHHANIDRLWEVWLRRRASPGKPAHANPNTDEAWMQGPADRAFAMPRPDGTVATVEAADVESLARTDYVYEDVSDPLSGGTRVARRLKELGMQPSASGGAAAGQTGGAAMARDPQVELVGASDGAVRIEGTSIETAVKMDVAAGRRISGSFQAGLAPGGAAQEPDRVFLNLENIRGRNDAALFDVFVALPAGADPQAHLDHRVGTVGLFGVSGASGLYGGTSNGLTKVLEITDVVDRLQLRGQDLDRLEVRFVPRRELLPQDDISIGRISVYRQGP